MHIYCRTPRAILLLGIGDDEGGVKRFPCDPSEPCRDYLYSETARGDKCPVDWCSLVDGELADLDVIQNFLRCHDGRWGRRRRSIFATTESLTPRVRSRT